MEGKMTKLEKYWILYDVGNSAFVLLVSTILPIYFNYLAGKGGVSEVDALAYWGYGFWGRWRIRTDIRSRFLPRA